jgi:hypothetical protein
VVVLSTEFFWPSASLSGAVLNRLYSFLMGTMGATVEFSVGLNPMPQDSVPAVLTPRREGLGGALKAVKLVGFPAQDDLERFIILVPAFLALGHDFPPPFAI